MISCNKLHATILNGVLFYIVKTRLKRTALIIASQSLTVKTIRYVYGAK